MAMTSDPLVRPITSDDVPRVARFLNERLNSRLSVGQWASAMVPPWSAPMPNHGFMLTLGDEVVGANLAFYSERIIAGNREAVCNLGALCVREDVRPHTFRLIRALLRQSWYSFTDLSPSGNVVEVNKRLGFTSLDTSSVVTVNLPRPSSGRIRLISDLDEIERLMKDPDRRIFQDHLRARAARHLLVIRGDEHCYVMFRRDRRKKIPVFASILYVGNKDLYRVAAGRVANHLLWKGLPATLSENRVVGFRPALGFKVTSPRTKMFKSTHLRDTDIDYLYSELTCVAW